MPQPFDLDVRFISKATGKRLTFNPDQLLSADWELLEAGGVGQITIAAAYPFETAIAQGGDIVEIWALGNGETAPRVRGQISIPEPSLDMKEVLTIHAYGLAEDMNYVVVDKVIYGPGKDLNWYAGEILDDYAARRGLNFVRDLKVTGIALDILTVTNSTVRAAFDKLFQIGNHNVVWGWDIEPSTGLDRAYIRPRQTAIGNQWFVGDKVKVVTSPNDYSRIINAVKLQGGDAEFPNVLTNPEFEAPMAPDPTSGDLIIDGSFEDTGDVNIHWYFPSSGRNRFAPDSGHLASAHTGEWYGEIASTSGELYQDVYPGGTLQNHTYVVSLFSRLRYGGAGSANLIIEGRTASNALTSDPPATLMFTPPSSGAWVGGQGSTVASGDAISLQFKVTDSTTDHIRVRILSLSSNSILIDDVVMSDISTGAQTGWQAATNAGGTFTWIDWTCKQAARRGRYGVRANVGYVNWPSSGCSIVPVPGYANNGAGGKNYHSAALTQQQIIMSCWVRMSPGVATAAGSVALEYLQWDTGGTYFSIPGSAVTIPNDGNWHQVTVGPLGPVAPNTATMTVAISLRTAGVYDIDEVFMGPSSADITEAGYFGGTKFERYVKAADVCTGGSDGANSATNYGTREAVLNNTDIIIWNATAIALMKAYFDRNAVPIRRSRVDLYHEGVQIPTPGSGLKTQVSQLNGSDLLEWPARVSYAWKQLCLAVSLELSNEGLTMARLLNSRSGAAASTSGGNVSAALSAGSGAGTPPTLRMPAFKTDTFAVGSGGPYTLSQTATGLFAMVFFDAAFQPSGYTVGTTTLTLAGGTDLTQFSTVTIVYSY